MYLIAYALMLVGFGTLTVMGDNPKAIAIGVVCFILNALVFWR